MAISKVNIKCNYEYFSNFIVILSFLCMFFISFTEVQAEAFGEDRITVGSCVLNVYTATDALQKSNGMLGFTDETFKKEGMIFIGNVPRFNYFHTMGMKMDIVIMGLIKIGEKTYKLSGNPVEARSGIESVKIYGESVFETPLKLYNATLAKCLEPNERIK